MQKDGSEAKWCGSELIPRLQSDKLKIEGSIPSTPT